MAKKSTKQTGIKTKPTVSSVGDFLNAVKDDQRRKDSFQLLEILRKATGEEPVMWGSAIIGFGNKKYKSPSTGKEMDWLRIGFSPRKANLSLYFTGGLKPHAAALKKLGNHKEGVGCLYINKLEEIDLKLLRGIIDASIK